MACLFAALVAVGGQIRVPIPGNPVPFTLQVVFVLMAGALMRPAVASGGMLLFMLSGVAGLPVFTGGAAGPAHLLGPTGGYLAGFVAGAAVCSLVLKGRRDSMGRIVVSMIAASATIHLLGMLHLAFFLGADFASAFQFGRAFLLLAGLKIVVAASAVSGYAAVTSKE